MRAPGLINDTHVFEIPLCKTRPAGLHQLGRGCVLTVVLMQIDEELMSAAGAFSLDQVRLV